MATFDPPEMPETRMSPNLMVGAASPLWAYFAAAAAGGVAYWWMTQWTRPVNLEAIFGSTSTAMPQPSLAEAVVEAASEMRAPVGGEAAPVSPLLAAAPAPEPVVEAAPEPAVEAAPEAAPEPVFEESAPASAEPEPQPRGKKTARPSIEDDA